ncbi:MAG: hypothetical protein J0H73_11130, partial [Salana multivorans]|nr:hypothetical protein [Salana multivorans]
MSSQQGPDWASFGRSGSRAIATPTLVVLLIGAAMVLLLLLATLGMDGVGAWVLRGIGAVLAVPVVMLAIRRTQVLGRLAQMERTG